MAYQYPGCPIVHELPKMVFRILGQELDWKKFTEYPYFNNWQRGVLMRSKDQRLESLLEQEPTFLTRLLVEKKFHVSVEKQREIEGYLRSVKKIEELDIPVDPAWGLDATVLESKHKRSFPAGTAWQKIRTTIPRYE